MLGERGAFSGLKNNGKCCFFWLYWYMIFGAVLHLWIIVQTARGNTMSSDLDHLDLR